MQRLLPRNSLVNEIRSRLTESPVTALLGARQVGKTTLAHMVAEGRPDTTIFDLERKAARSALEQTPELTLEDTSGLVTIVISWLALI